MKIKRADQILPEVYGTTLIAIWRSDSTGVQPNS